MKFFIVGCAKTGTWLLTRLFFAFPEIKKILTGGEVHIGHLAESDYNLCKRSYNSIFSNTFEISKINRDKKVMENNEDINIIYITRNKKDVLQSSGGYVTEKRYDDCEKQRKKYNDLINFEIKFENIISQPDVEQKRLADKFGLKIDHKWSKYPDFVPQYVFEYSFLKKRKNYRPRRLGEKI